MSPKTQQRAIAEACGWVFFPKDSNGIVWVTPPKGTPRKKYVPSALFSTGDIPKYLESHDAIQKALKTLKDREHQTYAELLQKQVMFICFATLEQQAEAFLRTKGTWVE